MNILHLGADSHNEYNSQHFRSVIPLAALARAGNRCNLMTVDAWMKSERKEIVSQADIIVVERLLVEEARDVARFWHDRGKAVVIDIDDSYSRLQPVEESFNAAARFWNQGMVDIHYGSVTYAKKLSVSPLEQFRQGLAHVTGLTSPSKYLNSEWKLFCKTWEIPNFLDSERYLPYRKEYRGVPKEILIFWGGSMSHMISFSRSGVSLALRKIIAKYPHVKFLLAGDNRILNVLKLPSDRVIYQPYVTYKEWPMVLSRASIVIAPLAGLYDSHRSNIKIMESSVLQLPAVATGSPTYEAFIDRKIGLYTKDWGEDDTGLDARADDWYNLLSETIENYDFHKKKAIADSEQAEYFWIDNRVPDILATYEDIIAHK